MVGCRVRWESSVSLLWDAEWGDTICSIPAVDDWCHTCWWPHWCDTNRVRLWWLYHLENWVAQVAWVGQVAAFEREAAWWWPLTSFCGLIVGWTEIWLTEIASTSHIRAILLFKLCWNKWHMSWFWRWHFTLLIIQVIKIRRRGVFGSSFFYFLRTWLSIYNILIILNIDFF